MKKSEEQATTPSAAQQSHPVYRSDIDGIRAIAVLLVVAFHAFPALVPGGYVGVDIFFVISGYLISLIIFKNLDGAGFSVTDFYIRRIKRILPALILVLAYCLVVAAAKMPLPIFMNVAKHVLGSTSFLENFLLLREQGYFDVEADLKPLLHIWSLSIEEQFYIVWPLLLMMIWRWRRVRAPLVCVLFVASMSASIWLVGRDHAAAFYLPWSRAWELMVGALLAWFTLSGQHHLRVSPSIRSLASVAGLAMIATAVVLLRSDSAFPGYWAILPTVGAGLMIAAGPSSALNRYLLSHRILVGIGLISYPLYLWHWPLLVFLNLSGHGGDSRRRIVMVLVAMALAWGTYRFVEKPVRRPGRSNAIAWGLAGGLVLVGAFAAYIYFNAGLRPHSAQVRSFLSYDYDYKHDFRNGKCLLSGEQKVFAAQCVEQAQGPAGAPLVLLWGDSHAAQLYRSIEALHGEARFALAQFTSSSCPPVIDFEKKDRPYCGMLNKEIAARIALMHPDTVLLAHDWPQSVGEGSLRHLPATIEFLRGQGVRHIVLVGPVPHWRVSLVASMYELLGQTGAQQIPVRTTFGLDPSISMLDRQLRDLADGAGVTYVSPYDFLCTGDGCLTQLPGNPSVPSAFDTAHLTRPVADAFIGAVKDKLLPGAISPDAVPEGSRPESGVGLSVAPR